MKEIVDKIYDIIMNYEFGDGENLDDIFDEVREKYEESIDVLTPEEVTEKEIEFKKLAEEIFNLCPKCNCIPLAVETTSGSKWITETNPDTVYNYCSDYMDENSDYVMPFQDDDMKFGDWKKISKDWDKMCELSGIKADVDEGDYCEFFHLSVYVYSKETNKIEYIPDINR